MPPPPHRPIRVYSHWAYWLPVVLLLVPIVFVIILFVSEIFFLSGFPEFLGQWLCLIFSISFVGGFMFHIHVGPYFLPFVNKQNNVPFKQVKSTQSNQYIWAYISGMILAFQLLITGIHYYDQDFLAPIPFETFAVTATIFVLSFGFGRVNSQFIRRHLERNVRRQHYCYQCGYDIHATICSAGKTCPECGEVIPPAVD